ncbi:hypothetical protein [Lacrimispora sp. 210928-DFI.3.58]|nr:hypothetical protein [Lacrimispora sp. 210928-DFI.3.58]MCB7319208.1 hypothetical protein [Lacrimispora sp. 210928-DFI.3.58]
MGREKDERGSMDGDEEKDALGGVLWYNLGENGVWCLKWIVLDWDRWKEI